MRSLGQHVTSGDLLLHLFEVVGKGLTWEVLQDLSAGAVNEVERCIMGNEKFPQV